MPDPQPVDTQVFAEAMATFREATSVILDAVDGYRAECIRRGYSETAAEKMAMTFHEGVLTKLIGGLR